jgi:hypothetical protein
MKGGETRDLGAGNQASGVGRGDCGIGGTQGGAEDGFG